ncbi:zinc-binding domain-containing protein [Aspergillus avenaceus]|uniref:Zinc-binding domain-containing protein n=1 Tax=Aspergillus avenaceus TaxID=36643 RepID=A0A5N6TYW2_ASPAV|nr:zinc-binding domain-containing protein [Aspergillus avenaceus]
MATLFASILRIQTAIKRQPNFKLAMPSKRSRSLKPEHRWSLYPSLHEDVSELLENDELYFDFHPLDNDNKSIRDYDTNIMGSFTCRNGSCPSTGWTSKKVAITIRMYPGEDYNARVYHQRCKRCNWISRPTLDQSYAERVAYRLKKWNGAPMTRQQYHGFKKSDGPYNSRLCEGCKAGHCAEGLGD